ncbi:hypothetical protein P9J83_14695 [Clostridium sporogenes]|uniref:Reverse transcriptase domain-containing protein n=1 Tax=Clostridium sporogenes TaxID=1509 RepID=A0AAE4JW38_CLOSG|nr:reverse transcriptase domain-containing protein [Clostridium sporogenes]MDS1004734.1 hypothetical protein [Clostridium sporogenes]
MNKNQIWQIVRQRDFSLTDEEVDVTTELIFDTIEHEIYDFSIYKREVFTQQGKKRVVYSYPKLSCEDILCQYLKRQIDKAFKIRYASRSRIINILFNILPVIKDMNDFVIIRADFKSFFDSVLTEHVYNKYIRESVMSRSDKELLEQYISKFKYCFAGLCLSNGMSEIVCRDFDERIKAKLTKYGVFFYERYVDDMLIITNRYISQRIFEDIMQETIGEVFGKCPVKLSMAPGKFSFISRRNLSTTQKFNFLGYEYEIKEVTKTKGNKTIKEMQFVYGIAKKKRRKYTGIIERAVIQYKKDNNLELLRQRIKLYSSRVVIVRTIGSSSFDWLTKGVVASYNELRYHTDALIQDTETFLKSLYINLLRKYKLVIPYFLKQSMTEDSIYSLYSTMKRNRTIMFEKSIGVSEETLLKWIKKLDPTYNSWNKDYYRIVVDYLEMIKVE